MKNKNVNTNEINKESWNAYQETYAKAAMTSPDRDYFSFFSNGGIDMEDYEPILSLAGDVKGLKVLDTCCSADAWQAYSLHNMGAKVTACDITPKAIEIASANAAKMGLDIDFVVADMQTLVPVGDGLFDIVFAHYPIWVQDFFEACRTWHRVLRKGGKLLLFDGHPVMNCIDEDRNYSDREPDWYDTFSGTPAADHIGGFHVDLPSVENFWRISDLLNAICDAGFIIQKVYEGQEESKKLPTSFSVMAIKQ